MKNVFSKKWNYKQEVLQGSKVTKYQILENEKVLKFPEIFQLWKTSVAFQIFYNNILADSPYEGFFWELPPVNQNWENTEFEFVLVNSNALPKIKPNFRPFQSFFNTTESIVSFPNLGKDAQLVVPTPISDSAYYPHFAEFVRHAPEHQKNKLWEVVSDVFQKKLNERPQWLSTSGLGVHWLHLRIDTRPKYYQYGGYRLFSS